MNEFDYLKIKKNKDLSNLSDFELVKLSQNDIDESRSKCYWKCPDKNCKGNDILYIHSLLENGVLYIHEKRCPCKKMINKRKIICNKKMILCGEEKPFDSIYFNELFARYQNYIVRESLNYKNIDSPDEIYCTLISSFFKTVFQFNRDIKSTLSNTSEKWFYSFFLTSLKNKLADMQKTKNYNKRNPLTTCLICGKEVNQINGDHLLEPGHEIINKDLIKKSLSKIPKEFIKEECLERYFRTFAYANIKNYVGSIHEKIKSEESYQTEIIDFNNKQVLKEETNIIEEIEAKEKAKKIAEILIFTNKNIIDKYFPSISSRKQKIKKISNLLLEEMACNENSKKKSILIKNFINMIRRNNECRIFLGKQKTKKKFVESLTNNLF